MSSQNQQFPTDPTGLPDARAPRELELADGAQVDLHIAPVSKKLGDATVRMLAYSGSIPGPTLRVKQGSTLTVNVVNDGDLDATVHWHGLRLDNRYDGTTETQQPIPVGGGFTYRLELPDPGVYWYHPHIRQDYGQEMGLYGNIVVEPSEPAYWSPANREITLSLDDVLLENGRVAPFARAEVTYAAMGRFGNALLVNGEPELTIAARRGEVVRFYVTNTANTRVFRLALPGARMKLAGSDSGHYEREQLVDDVVIAPSERAVVDVLFTSAGRLTLEHRTPLHTYSLATITIDDEPASPSFAAELEILRSHADLAQERASLARHLDASPDKTLGLVAEMDMGMPELPDGATLVYYCPMHPEVVSHGPGKCPLCSMKLLPRAQSADTESSSRDSAPHGERSNDGHSHGAHSHEATRAHSHEATRAHSHEATRAHSHEATRAHSHDTSGIEWEDDMVEVNRLTTPANTRWKLIDRATGAEGAAIDWRFRVGDRVKIRLVNEMESDHPMHHPFHIHGAGRFLILARDGVMEPNLVWKDTVLVPTGQTVDILLEVTHAGRWMAHCHIAEHHESGMMLHFDVDA